MLEDAGGRWFNKHFRYAEHVKTQHLHKANTGLTVHNMTIDTAHLAQAGMGDVWSAPSAAQRSHSVACFDAAATSEVPFESLLEDARHTALMKALALGPSSSKTLVFANSVFSAEAASMFLDEAMPEVRSAVLHKRVPAADREEVHVEFTAPDGEIQLLVATDMASRGLDTVEVGGNCVHCVSCGGLTHRMSCRWAMSSSSSARWTWLRSFIVLAAPRVVDRREWVRGFAGAQATQLCGSSRGCTPAQ